MAIYYVSSSYTGATSTGAINTPFKTLANVQSIMSTLRPGDSVLFKRGDTFSGTLNVTVSGTSALAITFGAYGTGSKPKFIGTGASIGALITANSKSYLVFDNIWITDPTLDPTDRTTQAKINTAFQFVGSSSYNTISNCVISLVGVGVYWTGPYNTMTKCNVSNMRMVRNTPTSQNPNDDYGANPVVISSANNTVSYCTFSGCWALSYDYGYDGGAIEFFGAGTSNNSIIYNTFNDCNGTVECGSSNGGVMENNVFAYNKVINNGKLFYINNSASSGFQVTVTNLQFYNNVIVESYINRLNLSELGSMAVNSSAAGIVVFKNNIVQLTSGIKFVRATQFSAGQMVHTNNVFKMANGSAVNLTLGVTEALTTNAYWTDTADLDPINWNYYPLTGSLLINKGTPVGFSKDLNKQKVSTTTPTIGVLEYI